MSKITLKWHFISFWETPQKKNLYGCKYKHVIDIHMVFCKQMHIKFDTAS